VNQPTHVAVQQHTSEYPQPITFSKGAVLTVGEQYAGPEEWANWFFCETEGQVGGWVPAQVIERTGDDTARATEDYTARELDVQPGDALVCSRTLNGWAWCERADASASGWVPLDHLQPLAD
jgi:hypothetical protein